MSESARCDRPSALNVPLVTRVRRNHALEHATLHVLGERQRGLRLMGHASPWGFVIYGNVPTEELLAAAQEGLRRLQRGQRHLAIHPNCGSNLVLAGILAAVGAFLALGGRAKGWRQRLTRLPLACVAATGGILLARPAGQLVQARLTTQADVGSLHIVEIAWTKQAGRLIHHIHTEG